MKRRFSASLKDKTKTNNNPIALAAKVEIRQRVLDAVGAEHAAVFDAFAGDGQLHKRVWRHAKTYVGCDTTWYRDDRLVFVADSRRVMRAIDLGPFNVFDFDAWGSPWEHALILAARRQLATGETIGVILTEGSSIKAKLGGLPHALAQIAGLRASLRGGGRVYDDVIDRGIAGLISRMHCRVVHRWQAQGKTGAGMRYIGLVLQEASALPGQCESAPAPRQ
jgi:hypothetical protein